MNVTHPYQGHYMEGAFLGFVSYASKRLLHQYASDTLANVSSPIPQSSAEREMQRFIDWCVVQFGTPEQIEEDDGAPDVR